MGAQLGRVSIVGDRRQRTMQLVKMSTIHGHGLQGGSEEDCQWSLRSVQ